MDEPLEGDRFFVKLKNLEIGDIVVWQEIPYGCFAQGVYLGHKSFLIMNNVWGGKELSAEAKLEVFTHPQEISAFTISLVLREGKSLILTDLE